MKFKLSQLLGITVVSGVVGYFYARRYNRLENEWCEKYLLSLTHALLKKIGEAGQEDRDIGEEIQTLLDEIPSPEMHKEVRFLNKLLAKRNWFESMEPAHLGILLLNRMEDAGLVMIDSTEAGARTCILTAARKNFLASL